MARLEDFYRDTVVSELQGKFNFGSVMEVPKVTKITLNMGLGEAVGDKKIVEHAVRDLTQIAGQQPVVTPQRRR